MESCWLVPPVGRQMHTRSKLKWNLILHCPKMVQRSLESAAGVFKARSQGWEFFFFYASQLDRKWCKWWGGVGGGGTESTGIGAVGLRGQNPPRQENRAVQRVIWRMMVAIEEMQGLDTSWGRISENMEDTLKVLKTSQPAAVNGNKIRGPCSGAETQAPLPPSPPLWSPGCIMCWHGEGRWPHHRSVYGSLGRWPWFLLLNYGKFILFIEGVASKSNKAVSSPWSGCGGGCHHTEATAMSPICSPNTMHRCTKMLGKHFHNLHMC